MQQNMFHPATLAAYVKLKQPQLTFLSLSDKSILVVLIT